MQVRSLWFACDHAGYDMQNALCMWATGQEMTVCVPNGTEHQALIDYPRVVPAVAQAVVAGQGYGVLICGSGVGMSIAANRFPGVRAVLAQDPQLVAVARAHNDANVLVLGARRTSIDVAIACLQALCDTPFDGGRHKARVKLLDHLGPALGQAHWDGVCV